MYCCFGVYCTLIYTGENSGKFTVKLHHRGHWFTPFSNKRYEKGQIDYFDNVSKRKFSRLVLEDIASKLGYSMPFGFLYKPHGKHLNAGKMVVGPKEAS